MVSLNSDSTVEKYAALCTMFLSFAIQLANNAYPTLPPCPIPPIAAEVLLILARNLDNNTPISDDIITACLSSLFIHTIPYTSGDIDFHVLRFIALCMIKKDGSYQPHHIVSRMLAQLQYCVRIAFINLYLGMEESKHMPVWIAEQCLDSNHENMWDYLTECGKNTPFWALRSWMRLFTTVTLHEALPDATYWVDTARTTLTVGRHTVSIPDIRTTLQKTFEHVGTLMNSLTQGAVLPSFDRSAYSDNPHVSDVGFNYLVSSHSYHQQYGQHYLLNQWLAKGDPWGFTQSGLNESSGRIQWNDTAIQRWLDISDELTAALYFCFHCGCGQPARGVEEMTIKIINIPESSRNVFWRGDRFMIQTTYHKGQSKVGHGKNRVTFLPGLLSQHLHNYLAFIRPMQM